METKTSLIIVVVAYLVLGLGMANAQVITIGIEAVVKDVEDDDNHLEGRIKPGDLITGSYTYNTLTPDANPNGDTGDYWHNDAPYGISLNAGGFILETDPANVNFLVEILNRGNGDNYLLQSYNNVPLSNGVMGYHISWQLDDFSGQAISNTNLTDTAPVLANWESLIGLNFSNKDLDFFVLADVTSAVVIPEPATLILLGLGTAGFSTMRRRS